MSTPETRPEIKENREGNKERPFSGLKIYYSGSIKGGPESETSLPMNLVNYMKAGDANVLSEHVAVADKQERDRIFAKKSGISYEEFISMPDKWFFIRKQDLGWVREATHLVALVNAPSHGVGMEIQEALRKPQFGFNLTPVLCLIREDKLEKLSGMVRGVSEEESSVFQIKTYKNEEDAKNIIYKFLINKFDGDHHR